MSQITFKIVHEIRKIHTFFDKKTWLKKQFGFRTCSNSNKKFKASKNVQFDKKNKEIFMFSQKPNIKPID